jgi:cytoskeletal protein CcmA (bactofilin family)
MEGETPTVIDVQADIEGTLKGKDARILGRFKGEVAVSGRLVLGEGSRVEAQVSADAAEIGGEFRGDIKARSVSLAEKARVHGRIDTQVLKMHDGAYLDGSVNAGRTGALGG